MISKVFLQLRKCVRSAALFRIFLIKGKKEDLELNIIVALTHDFYVCFVLTVLKSEDI